MSRKATKKATKTKRKKKAPGSFENLNSIYVKKSKIHGRGVFAGQNIATGQIIEIAPIILLPKEEQLIHNLDFFEKGQTSPELTSLLSDYMYEATDGRYAVALGYASLYNQSDAPNAGFSLDEETLSITVTALANIKANKEILINYGWEEEEESSKDWIPTYIEWMEASQEDAVAEQDFETAEKLKAAVELLK